MKPKGNFQFTIALILIAILVLGGYIAYKNYGQEILNVLPSPSNSPSTSTTKNEESPVIVTPKSGSKISSPITIRGTVPPTWMFEGVFPIKLVDSRGKTLVQGQAIEEVPGSWQSNTPVYFTATLTFTTTASSGFIVLENDNPSGDPSKTKTFKFPVTF